MQQPIVIMGRTLTLSGGLPASLTFTLTPPAVDSPALRTTGKGGQAVLIDKISVSVSASGTYGPGATFTGTGSDSIVAATPRVTCEGKQLLTEGDNVTVTCNGTITTSAGGSPGTATVVVTITDGVQKNVNANKA